MRKHLISIPLLLILAFACAFALRLSYATVWENNPQRATFNGTPLLLNMDGYFYLRVAKQIQQDTYDSFDEKSVYPQGAPRRSVPPLLSSLTAWTSSAFSMTLEKAALLLPAIIGSLVVFPIFFLGRAYGGNVTGFCAALFAGLAHGLIQRTSYGFFDTDGGNVFFAATCAALFMQFGLAKTWKRYIWFLAGIATYGLYLLWWDQTILAATALAILPLIAALIVDYRPPRREALLFGGLTAAAALVVLLFLGPDFLKSLSSNASRTLSYIAKEKQFFPNPSMFVGEQTILGFQEIASMVASSIPGFVLGLLGLALLVWKARWQVLYLIGMLLIGSLVVTSFRFVIFFIPVVSIGTAFIITYLWSLDTKRTTWRMASVGCAVLIVLLQCMHTLALKNTTVPANHPEVVEAMASTRSLTEEDSVIWTNWNLAYPLMLYSERSTIVDGQSRTPLRNWVVNVPFACKSQRQAANWMQFYAAHGQDGLQKARDMFGGAWNIALPQILQLLSEGPEQAEKSLMAPFPERESRRNVLNHLFPKLSKPLYIFIDHRTMNTPWFTIGAWDFEKDQGQIPLIMLFVSSIVDAHTIKAFVIKHNTIMYADLDKGKAKVGTVDFEISKYITFQNDSVDIQEYSDGGYILGFNPAARGGSISSPEVVGTVLYELLVADKYNDTYFNPVLDRPIVVQCWRVYGDRYEPAH